MRDRRVRHGVTLVEVLVAVGVIGLVAGLVLSGVQAVRASASRAACANHLRQIGLAAALRHDAVGVLPPHSAVGWPIKRPGWSARLTWGALLLPYVGEIPLWDTLPAAHAAAPSYDLRAHPGLATVVRVYTCPTDGRLAAPLTDAAGYTAAYGSYVGVLGDRAHPAAMEFRRAVRLTDVTDGTSQTLLFGERPPPGRLLSGTWYNAYVPEPDLPYSTGLSYSAALRVWSPAAIGPCKSSPSFRPGRLANPCDSQHFWSLHPGGGNFAFCDGSVRFLPYSADAILPALATRAGGEVAPLD